jgi:Ca-activated chloride channel homolog
LTTTKLQTNPIHRDELLTLKIRYKQPGGNASKLLSRVLKDEGKAFQDAGGDFRFAAVVAMFGMDLRGFSA